MRVDRLFRKLQFLLEFIEKTGNMGTNFVFLDFPELSTTTFGKAMFSIMDIIGEVEKALIHERSKDGRIA